MPWGAWLPWGAWRGRIEEDATLLTSETDRFYKDKMKLHVNLDTSHYSQFLIIPPDKHMTFSYLACMCYGHVLVHVYEDSYWPHPTEPQTFPRRHQRSAWKLSSSVFVVLIQHIMPARRAISISLWSTVGINWPVYKPAARVKLIDNRVGPFINRLTGL